MSRIVPEDAKRVAALARLRLDDEELSEMTAHLERILGYVDLLSEVDTADVEPMAHAIPLATPTREDEPSGEFAPEQAMANAPAAEDMAFAVPKVLDDEVTG
ncbi:MAG: Asp-tRNA(Asn)/Glu-tRNA(Gln) amidotransferase subunit GatC [bacterium]|nr:Asp-tRNA(Asn)/Glu-tRNA(Gln) amidotransferase subunit GatC [bacterium]